MGLAKGVYPLLDLVVVLNQAWFMGAFFLISGWFVRRRATILGLTGGGGISLGYILAPHVSNGLIGSLGFHLPSSYRIIIATPVIGFVIE